MRRGFSLLEAMVAMGLAGVLAGTVSATFKGSILEQAKSRHEWEAFTIAQQTMERWSAMPRASALLDQNSTTSTPGTAADNTCTGVTAGERHKKVDAYGVASVTGAYDVCVKVTDANPEPTLKNVRVIVEFADATGVSRNIVLQTFR